MATGLGEQEKQNAIHISGPVTAGCGWVQRDGGSVEEIRPGDVVWFPPGEKDGHRAGTTGMTHIAIQEKKNGKAVERMEHVSDEEYRR